MIPKPEFEQVEFNTRGLRMTFRATPERINRIVAEMIDQLIAATEEVKKLEQKATDEPKA